VTAPTCSVSWANGVADDTAPSRRRSTRRSGRASSWEGVALVPGGLLASSRLARHSGPRYGPARVARGRHVLSGPEKPRIHGALRGRRPPAGTEPVHAKPRHVLAPRLSNVDSRDRGGEPARRRRAGEVRPALLHVARGVPDRLRPAGVHEAATWPRTSAFVGVSTGIWTGTPSPGLQYTLLDARFEASAGRHREAAAASPSSARSSGTCRPQSRSRPADPTTSS